MSENRLYDVSNHTTVYRIVPRPGGEDLVCEHSITEVTPTEVHVSRAACNEDVPPFYQTRTGTYVLDRGELERTGSAQFDSGQTRFYLKRRGVTEKTEGPERGDGNVASNPDLQPLPAISLQVDVAERFEKVAASLESRYGDAFSKRLLLETVLRQAFADIQAHGKDSPLVLQLDTLSIQGKFKSLKAGRNLRPLPVDHLHVEVITHLQKILSILKARYEGNFSERHFFEVVLRQMFADLRIYEHESTVIQWLDISLQGKAGAVGNAT